MSDTVWELPESALEPSHLVHVVRKAISEVEGSTLEPMASDEVGLSFHVGVPEWMVRDAGDRPRVAPDDEGRYWCVLRYEPGSEGRPAKIGVPAHVAGNDLVPNGAAEILERVAMLLGATPG